MVNRTAFRADFLVAASPGLDTGVYAGCVGEVFADDGEHVGSEVDEFVAGDVEVAAGPADHRFVESANEVHRGELCAWTKVLGTVGPIYLTPPAEKPTKIRP